VSRVGIRDVHGGAATAAVAVAARQRQFIFHYRRGAAASEKRKFKKLVNLLKIFILKNATL